MSRADELLAELRRMVEESRDDEVPDFFHDTGQAAWFANAFEELDWLLSDGQPMPEQWQPRG